MSEKQTYHSVTSDIVTLVIFYKRPLMYQGKKRLAASIGPESAFYIAKALLNCALENAYAWPGKVVLSISNKKDAVWASTLLTRSHSIIIQNRGNLGRRIDGIDKQLRIINHQNWYLLEQTHRCSLQNIISKQSIH
jgi:glycosyltransferase A (GT-A) superfamily protein (DUF2064 family)